MTKRIFKITTNGKTYTVNAPNTVTLLAQSIKGDKGDKGEKGEKGDDGGLDYTNMTLDTSPVDADVVPVNGTRNSVLSQLKISLANIKSYVLGTLFNTSTGHDHDGTDSKKIAASNVDGLADYFNASTGHDHDGTDSKKIAYANLTGTPAVFPLVNNAGAHNSVYRGISLGTSVSAAQYAAISAGTFEDMYIGDYWTISGSVYRIAAFNYFYNCGVTPFTSNHVTIVPDSSLAFSVMNDTDTTAGGYYGSGIRASGSGLASASAIINSAFNGHVATHSQYLTNAVTNGKPSGGSWYDCSVELMSEIMVYGGGIFKPVSDGTTVIINYTVSKTQLPLFALNPKLIISSRYSWWLRDIVSAALFAYVDTYGLADCNLASTSSGVRPAFSII